MTLIAAGTGSGLAAHLLRARPLRWLGERSYGIYLWHWPIVALLRPGVDVSWPPLATAIVTVTAAAVLGTLSYRFVEQPFLRRSRPIRSPVVVKRRLVAAWAGTAVALAVLAALTIRLPTRDPVVASLRAGERIVAAQQLPDETAPPAAS